LKWMLGRIEGHAQAVEHVFGFSPAYADIDWAGLSFSQDQFAKITLIDRQAWQEEFGLHAELFEKLNQGLPSALIQMKKTFEQRLAPNSI